MRRKTVTKKLATIILIGIVLIGGIFYPELFGNEGNEDLEVHYIDVGQGDSILVKSKAGNILIDSGSNSYSDYLIDYLLSENISGLDYVIVTHPHEDHIGSMDEVMDYFQVDKVIMPNVIHTSQAFENLIDSIERNGLSITPASAGDSYRLGESEILILGPISEKYSNLNNYSVVLKLINGKNSFLFTGDAENLSENEILDTYYNLLDSDVLKLGHHGSITSTSEDFLKAVNPDYGVISVGTGNSYGHPNQEILELLELNDIEYYRTDLNGSIIFSSDGEKIYIP